MSTDPNSLADPLRSLIVEVVLPRARKDGKRVTVVSARRTKAEQEKLRRKNGCPDIYKSPASSCRVPTAIPGTSNHESGRAVDLGGDVEWVARTFPQLGRPVRGEPWHFEFTGTVPDVTDPGQLAGAAAGAVPGADALRSIGEAFTKLADPGTWLRILQLVAGAALTAAGLAVIVGDSLGARKLTGALSGAQRPA